MTNLYLYLGWYTFYGQFDFLNHLLMWILDLNNNGTTFGNPFLSNMHIGIQTYPKWLFLISGIGWDFIILRLIQMRFFKRTHGINTLDYEN